jgi:hypothetical protein
MQYRSGQGFCLSTNWDDKEKLMRKLAKQHGISLKQKNGALDPCLERLAEFIMQVEKIEYTDLSEAYTDAQYQSDLRELEHILPVVVGCCKTHFNEIECRHIQRTFENMISDMWFGKRSFWKGIISNGRDGYKEGEVRRCKA